MLLLLAFVLRIGAAAYWHQTAQSEGRLFRLGDSHSYWVLANQLGHSLPYEYGSSESRMFRAPLYPLLLAPLTRIGEEQLAVWWARVVGCLLGTVSVGLVGLLALRLGGITAALIATGLAAIYPSAIGMSIIVLSEAVFMPLMIGYLLAWNAAWVGKSVRSTWSYGLLAGVLSGAAVLARPSWLLFAPFAWFMAVLCGRFAAYANRAPKVAANDQQQLARRTVGGKQVDSEPNLTATPLGMTHQPGWRHTWIFMATGLGLSLVMSPWWIRNAAITGRFVPTTLQVGPSLLDGLHSGASGASDEGMAFMRPIIAEQIRADQQTSEQKLVSTLEYRINARAQRTAMQWAVEHPTEVLALAGRKFLRIWTLWPDGGDINSMPIRIGITVSSFTVLLLALVFHFQSCALRGWFYLMLWLPSLYFTLLHMVFVGSIRYREPALFVLIAVAACSVASLFAQSPVSFAVVSNAIFPSSTRRVERRSEE